MIRLVLSAIALSLFAGCATDEPKNNLHYQIGVTGSRQSKIDAQRVHAAQSLQGPTATLDSSPSVLSSQFPDYPRHLQNAGIEGRVVVHFTVETDGSVSDATVQGSPAAQLAALTLNAIKQWKFTPAMKGGVPVRARIQQPFEFKLE